MTINQKYHTGTLQL